MTTVSKTSKQLYQNIIAQNVRLHLQVHMQHNVKEIL